MTLRRAFWELQEKVIRRLMGLLISSIRVLVLVFGMKGSGIRRINPARWTRILAPVL